MSVTATVPYKGATLVGLTFKVESAYIKQQVTGAPWMVYQVEVKMPDGSAQPVPEWDNVKGDVNLAGSVLPMVQAEAHMRARLTAAGATNIVVV